jgi:hypothetical protein
LKLLDALLGRTKPAQANLERLFGLPDAAITLETAAFLKPTNQGGVCFKPMAGRPFADTRQEMEQLLNLGEADRLRIGEQTDKYGYVWIVLEADEYDSLVTRVHLVNTTLQENGYGPQLLCSVFGFQPAPGVPELPPEAAAPPPARRTFLVYLYKRGTFYPFVPLEGEHRDNETELKLKALLTNDISIEPDLDRWFPLWELPLR